MKMYHWKHLTDFGSYATGAMAVASSLEEAIELVVAAEHEAVRSALRKNLQDETAMVYELPCGFVLWG